MIFDEIDRTQKCKKNVFIFHLKYKIQTSDLSLHIVSYLKDLLASVGTI